MKKFTKVISLFLSLCLAISIFSACKGKTTSTSDGSIELKFVFGGVGEMKDSDLVWEEFNKELKNYLPNTTVDFECLTYSEFAEKWKLMSASRETVDVVWMGFPCSPLQGEVEKGSLMPLDKLIEDHTTDLTRELPEWLFDLGKVDGETYFVPCYQMMTNLPGGFMVHQDLAEKHGLDYEAISKNFTEKEGFLTREDFKPFEDYLEKLKQAGELRKGVAPSFLIVASRLIGKIRGHAGSIAANAIIDMREDTFDVYDANFDFDNSEYYEMAYDWYKKGYIRKDIMSIQDRTADENKEDGYVLWRSSYFEGESERLTKKHGFPILAFPFEKQLYVNADVPSTNLAISSTSKYPEEAIKLIELLNTEKGKKLYNLLVYGIEGKHYKMVSENKIEWLEESAPGASSENNYGYDDWALGNSFNAYETQFDTEGWNDYIRDEVNGKATPSPLIGFSFDRDPVELEIAQYTAIEKEYEYLIWGTNKNYEKLINERNKKFKAAGCEKIVKEAQKQLDEWKKRK